MDNSLPASSVHGISQQEYWSGLPFPPPGDLPDPGIEHTSVFPAWAGGVFTIEPPGKPNNHLGSLREKKDAQVSYLKILVNLVWGVTQARVFLFSIQADVITITSLERYPFYQVYGSDLVGSKTWSTQYL